MLKKLEFIGGVALSALCLIPNVLTAQEIQAPTPSQQAQVNLFTIPNQSASYVRMPARQASQEIDAVFFNPAGTVNLDEGFHFTFNNQMLNQWVEIDNDYVFFDRPKSYSGKASGYIFPSTFLAYKKGNWNFHGGIMMVAGAGGAKFSDLPASDRGVADIIPALQASFLNTIDADEAALGNYANYSGLTDYRYNFESQGVGFSPGGLVGVAYKVNDWVSVGAQVRYAQQITQAEGYVTDIEVYHPDLGGWQSPETYLYQVEDSTGSTIAGLAALAYAELGADRYIDVKQQDGAFTPIVSIQLTPHEDIVIAAKYEHKTDFDLVTEVIDGKDGGGVYTDKEVISSDLPAYLGLGLSYTPNDRLTLAYSFKQRFFKQADLNGREEEIESNQNENEFAIEYAITPRLAVSGGYSYYNSAGFKPTYHRDGDFLLSAHSIAGGAAFNVSDKTRLNIGALFTHSIPQTHTLPHLYADGEAIAIEPAGYVPEYQATFRKRSLIFSVGVDMHFGKKSSTNNSL